MSFVGSDDQPICDMCTAMYPARWPDGFYEPWPAGGPLFINGRMTRDRRDSFHLCESCLQALVLRARLPLDGRELARESAERWRASQRLLDQAEAVVRPPRVPRRLAG